MMPLNISDMLSIFQNAFTLKKSIFSFGTGDMLGKSTCHDLLPILQSILILLFDLSYIYNFDNTTCTVQR